MNPTNREIPTTKNPPQGSRPALRSASLRRPEIDESRASGLDVSRETGDRHSAQSRARGDGDGRPNRGHLGNPMLSPAGQ